MRKARSTSLSLAEFVCIWKLLTYNLGMEEMTAHVANGQIEEVSAGAYRLDIDAGEAGAYRLAQLDDYSDLSRGDFRGAAPMRVSLQMRVSMNDVQGTWGVALWNDPFSLSLGLGGGTRRLPALPNAVWFFFGSAANYLSFTDDLPGHGLLAGVFRSLRMPLWLMAPAGLGLPLLGIPFFARLARRAARVLIKEDSTAIEADWTLWHDFRFEWTDDGCTFWLDGEKMFHTPLSPKGPLGLVLWIDNQFVALPPDGKLAFGTLENQAVRLEIKNLDIDYEEH